MGTVKPEAATFTPQSSLAQWGASAAMQVVSRRQSEVRVPWLHNLAAAQDEDRDEQTDTEGEETEQEDESETEEQQLSEVRWPHGPAGRRGLRRRATGQNQGSGTWHPGTALFTPPAEHNHAPPSADPHDSP